jgi:hypothetical protein
MVSWDTRKPLSAGDARLSHPEICLGDQSSASFSALGPGVPDPPKESVKAPKSTSRHGLAAGALVLAQAVMGGLHHDYSLALVPVRP